MRERYSRLERLLANAEWSIAACHSVMDPNSPDSSKGRVSVFCGRDSVVRVRGGVSSALP